jgi:hypothetical protein
MGPIPVCVCFPLPKRPRLPSGLRGTQRSGRKVPRAELVHFYVSGKPGVFATALFRLVKIATFYLLCQPQAGLRHVQQEGLIGRSLLVLNEPPRTRWRASGNRQQKAYSELSPSLRLARQFLRVELAAQLSLRRNVQ